MQRLILPLPGNEAFAARLAAACGGEAGRIETRRFPDGETYLRLQADPAGREVDLVCTLARPDPQFLALVFAADAARELGATRVNLVAPYLAYMRQDMRFHAGECISSLSFARLLSSTFDRLLTVDPHLHRHATLSALYTIPTATLQAAPLLADWIAANVDAPLVVGPDEESEQWAGAIAARIHAPHVVLRKTRLGDRSVDIELPDLTAWRDRTPVLVDDIASSGRTLAVAARKLAAQGLRTPECVVVHALFADGAWDELAPLFARIASTDAVPHPSNRIALAPLLADALVRGLGD
ncbi:ribose-phosphate pyrophosphokinase [Luteimonas sp. BDR2-5]|uniref:ribose-phosphate pyrophosphokinase n=1 Tax=Proluteimonas luteida TaxID=2878685 RepID=UPI001E2A51AA|nr:ribose-phosphate pyrophosphokinase [Luteimonas sp. BDR2-5]MCD9029031.1 ribose-phosphate pyrophosphokinase [Luteimonas sp. BDR2-5]